MLEHHGSVSPLESYKHTETYKGLQKSTRELREGETSFFFLLQSFSIRQSSMRHIISNEGYTKGCKAQPSLTMQPF